VRLTRRQALGGGAAALVGMVGVGYGRYAVGDEFEEHVASTFGVSLDRARSLIDTARRGLTGRGEYEAVAAAFLASTTFPGRHLLPRGTREHAVRVFVNEAMPHSATNLLYLGYVEGDVSDLRCRGLIRS
jgi:hypothetical protein